MIGVAAEGAQLGRHGYLAVIQVITRTSFEHWGCYQLQFFSLISFQRSIEIYRLIWINFCSQERL